MLDIKFIKNNTEFFDRSLLKRNIKLNSKDLISLYDEYIKTLNKNQDFQAKRNKISKEIGKISRENPQEAKKLKEEVLSIKNSIAKFNVEIEKKKNSLEKALAVIPNILDEKVPLGDSDDDNSIIKKYGKIKKFSFKVKDHVTIAENLELMNYEQANKISGSRFSVLKSELALLYRGLINFMLDIHTKKNGYTEVVVPELVKTKTLYGTGQLPKFKEDLFSTAKDLWLIPTAEVSLTNLHRDEIIDCNSLPLRFTSFTNCFRAEAGSAGIDTKGLIREHQFGKVELVSITKPDDSSDELKRMTDCIEKILILLELPFRLVELCSSDIGFASSYTIDFEVWMPGQNKYREVSSCSNCKDFQARRMNMRSKDKSNNNIFFPHTLNGSGLAVGRVIVAILENFQQENGSVIIPKVLRKYVGDITEITKK